MLTIKKIENYFDRKHWFLSYIIIFVILYGLSLEGTSAFKILYKNPYVLLPKEGQWLQESPIQFLLGYYLFRWSPWYVAYFAVQFLGVSYFVFSIRSFLKTYELNSDQFLRVLAISPLILILITWHGKPDIFTVAAFFSILAFHGRNTLILILSVLVAVFAHPQIAIIHVSLAVFLGLLRPNPRLISSYIFSFLIYFLYKHNLEGDLFGRSDWIFEYWRKLLKTQLYNPIFSIVGTFGWFWLIVYQVRQKLSFRFWIAFVLCYLITLTTFDHTRIFVLVSLPLITYTYVKCESGESLDQIKKFLPIFFMFFIQLQKRPGGSIVDSSWSWYWLSGVLDSLGQ